MIDVSFDFRTETPAGKDADDVSPTLRGFHQILWSKPLRSGAAIDLTAPPSRRSGYLINDHPGAPKLWFGSDAITQSYTRWSRPKVLAEAMASLDTEQRARYLDPPYTMASAMIWPVRSADRPTINQARGTRAPIADRIDLTLECIRRYFENDSDSPLSDVLIAYRDFFAMFGGFAEFATFFHFQDLVTADFEQVRFFLPFDDFARHGAPRSVDEYVTYREATLAFIAARERRMSDWIATVHARAGSSLS